MHDNHVAHSSSHVWEFRFKKYNDDFISVKQITWLSGKSFGSWSLTKVCSTRVPAKPWAQPNRNRSCTATTEPRPTGSWSPTEPCSMRVSTEPWTRPNRNRSCTAPTEPRPTGPKSDQVIHPHLSIQTMWPKLLSPSYAISIEISNKKFWNWLYTLGSWCVLSMWDKSQFCFPLLLKLHTHITWYLVVYFIFLFFLDH